MPDEERPKMSNFGKKTTGENYKNPVATWQTIVVIESWDDWRKRDDRDDFYLLAFFCPNCKWTVDIAILRGYDKPKKFMCDECRTLQDLPEQLERREVPKAPSIEQAWRSDDL